MPVVDVGDRCLLGRERQTHLLCHELGRLLLDLVLDRRFEAAWAARARDRANGHPSYRMVRFADDFVVLVRGSEAQAQGVPLAAVKVVSAVMAVPSPPQATGAHSNPVRPPGVWLAQRLDALAVQRERDAVDVPAGDGDIGVQPR
jgi:hypothetical protein